MINNRSVCPGDKKKKIDAIKLLYLFPNPATADTVEE